MKKLIALLSVFFIVISCTPSSNDTTNIYYELTPIETVELPAEFHVNTDNLIVVNFYRNTSCHGFDGFYYDKVDFTRTIAVQSFVLERNDCENLTNDLLAQTLRFRPTEPGTYLLKFWKGKDANGDNIFEEISVDVQ